MQVIMNSSWTWVALHQGHLWLCHNGWSGWWGTTEANSRRLSHLVVNVKITGATAKRNPSAVTFYLGGTHPNCSSFEQKEGMQAGLLSIDRM